jgi:hypothetical protein
MRKGNAGVERGGGAEGKEKEKEKGRGAAGVERRGGAEENK